LREKSQSLKEAIWKKDVVESNITRKEFLRRAAGAVAVPLVAVDRLVGMTAKRFAIAVIVLFTLFSGSALASEADAIAISQNIGARSTPQRGRPAPLVFTLDQMG
jgi:hypothetical protein